MPARPSGETLQQRRLAQLDAMTGRELAALIDEMRQISRLPRLDTHFRRHGLGVGATTVEEYVQLFQEHIRLQDLRRFTFIRPETADIRWYLIDLNSGNVALYNETHRRYWSFFYNRNVPSLLKSVSGDWIEVFQDEGDWQYNPW